MGILEIVLIIYIISMFIALGYVAFLCNSDNFINESNMIYLLAIIPLYNSILSLMYLLETLGFIDRDHNKTIIKTDIEKTDTLTEKSEIATNTTGKWVEAPTTSNNVNRWIETQPLVNKGTKNETN